MKRKECNLIKEALTRRNKTQVWLAAALKVSKTTINNWATNREQPRLDTLCEIAQLLDIDPRELINPAAVKLTTRKPGSSK